MQNTTRIVIYAETSDGTQSFIYDWLLASNTEARISIPSFLNEHAVDIRTQYLSFVQGLSQQKIGDSTLASYFTINGGYSLWHMGLIAEKNLVKSPQISNCLKLLALERLLLRDDIRKVKLVSTDTVIGASIQQLCYNMQIPITWNGEGINRKSSHFLQLIKALRIWFLFLREKFSFRKVKMPHWFIGEQSLFIFSYFFNMDIEQSNEQGAYSRYWQDLSIFLRRHDIKTNWLNFFIADKYFSNPASASKFVNKINERSHVERHSFFIAYLPLSTAFNCVVRYLYYWLKGWSTDVSLLLRPKESSVSFEILLGSDWNSSTSGPVLMQNLLWVHAFDNAIGTLPKQKAGFFLQENTAWEPAFIHAWRKYGHGILTGVAHATIRFWDLRYFYDAKIFKQLPASTSILFRPRPDRIAVNNPTAYANLEASGQPREEIVPVEALRYQGYSHSLRPEEAMPVQKTILICGDIDPASTIAMLRCLEKAVALFTEEEFNCIKLIFKQHPACSIQLDVFQIPRFENFTGSMQQAIKNSQILIAPDSTTAAVEGFEEGLVVILFSFADRVNFSPLMGLPEVSFVSTPEEMIRLIAEVPIIYKGGKKSFFWRDENLPKWSQLLSEVGYLN